MNQILIDTLENIIASVPLAIVGYWYHRLALRRERESVRLKAAVKLPAETK